MDSLTQLVLGAAIAELTLGKKIGNKALLWGAVCGTIPDLDVFLNPFLSDLQELGSHRGFSHSILFSFLLAPILGSILWCLYEKKEANWKEWTLMCFLSLVTHPVLDAFTNYGTQLFLPFSNYRVALNNIFSVDLLYTMPMLLCLLIILFISRKRPARSIINRIGFFISHTYMCFTLVNKVYIDYVFEDALDKRGISFERYMTCPMPLQNMLWYCIAETEQGFYWGYYSWMDKNSPGHFYFISKNDRGLKEVKQTFALKRLNWFSNGYLAFTRENGELYANDLRFGKTTMINDKKGEFIIKWKIIEDKENVDLLAVPAKFRWDKNEFDKLKHRIIGIKSDSL